MGRGKARSTRYFVSSRIDGMHVRDGAAHNPYVGLEGAGMTRIHAEIAL